MPIHDWTRVDAGLFHHFHQRWVGTLCDALNNGVLPEGVFALVDQRTAGIVPGVLSLASGPQPGPGRPGARRGGTTAPVPRTRFVSRATNETVYAARANRIAVHHTLGEVIAVIEIVSPGNKSSRHALRSFVSKSVELLQAEIHLLVVDLFPPTPREPQGIHKAIWDEIRDEAFELPADKPLTLASYCAIAPVTAYVEPVAVGDVLPDLALFLGLQENVPVPLEATYQQTWNACPAPLRDALVRES